MELNSIGGRSQVDRKSAVFFRQKHWSSNGLCQFYWARCILAAWQAFNFWGEVEVSLSSTTDIQNCCRSRNQVHGPDAWVLLCIQVWEITIYPGEHEWVQPFFSPTFSLCFLLRVVLLDHTLFQFALLSFLLYNGSLFFTSANLSQDRDGGGEKQR